MKESGSAGAFPFPKAGPLLEHELEIRKNLIGRRNDMKPLAFLSALALCIALFAPAASAQSSDDKNHGNFGVYFDYTRLKFAKTNFFGVGARLGVNVHPHIVLEGEMAYDFNQVFTEGFTDATTGSVTLQRSNVRVLHGLFGPKIQSHGPVRVFLTVKGGFVNFRFDDRPATFSTFTSSVDSLRTSNVRAVLYPGGGFEGFLGPIGLRLDVGDEIYFLNGAHHGLRIAFGPHIRF